MPTCPECHETFPEETTHCAHDGTELLPSELFLAADADLAPGQMVGEYRLEERLGRGGFGSVYRAVHPLIGKKAAVKVLNREFAYKPEMVARFIAEARAVNQIQHSNIVDIFSFGTLPDRRQYYVMELVEGIPFDRYLKERGRLGVSEIVRLLTPIARALDAAHAKGIAHRDLKPENILLAFDSDGKPVPKLLDFGVAKLFGDTTTQAKSVTGMPIGTPHYMSPEQCRGGRVDQRTDVYSFGVMVHEALTGKRPFDGSQAIELILKQIQEAPPTVSSICPDLPEALDVAVLRMLEKDPQSRPSSVSDALQSLLPAGAPELSDAASAQARADTAERSRPDAAAQALSAEADTVVLSAPLALDTLVSANTMADAAPSSAPAASSASGASVAVSSQSTHAERRWVIPRRARLTLFAAMGLLGFASAKWLTQRPDNTAAPPAALSAKPPARRAPSSGSKRSSSERVPSVSNTVGSVASAAPPASAPGRRAGALPPFGPPATSASALPGHATETASVPDAPAPETPASEIVAPDAPTPPVPDAPAPDTQVPATSERDGGAIVEEPAAPAPGAESAAPSGSAASDAGTR